MLKSSLFLALTLSSSLAHARGDGGGINGPNLEGDSIPVQLEGLVEVEDVRKASNICYQEGDPSRGVESLSLKLFRTVFGQRPYQIYRENLPDFDRARFAAIRGGVRSVNDESLRSDRLYFEDEQYGAEISTLSIWKSGSYIGLVNLGEILPRFVWEESKEVCDGYDALGSCVNPRTVPVGLVIRRGAKHGTAVPLINERTKRPTAITINAEEIAQCMVRELKRLAK